MYLNCFLNILYKKKEQSQASVMCVYTSVCNPFMQMLLHIMNTHIYVLSKAQQFWKGLSSFKITSTHCLNIVALINSC